MRFAGKRHLALNPLWNKNNFWIILAVQHGVVHLSIAAVVSALATRGVDNDVAACFSGCRVKLNCAALQLERSFYSVERGAEREGNLGSRRIKVQRDALRLNGGRENDRAKNSDGSVNGIQ